MFAQESEEEELSDDDDEANNSRTDTAQPSTSRDDDITEDNVKKKKKRRAKKHEEETEYKPDSSDDEVRSSHFCSRCCARGDTCEFALTVFEILRNATKLTMTYRYVCGAPEKTFPSSLLVTCVGFASVSSERKPLSICQFCVAGRGPNCSSYHRDRIATERHQYRRECEENKEERSKEF